MKIFILIVVFLTVCISKIQMQLDWPFRDECECNKTTLSRYDTRIKIECYNIFERLDRNNRWTNPEYTYLELKFNNSKISYITKSMFNGLPNWYVMDLANISLRGIEENAFKNIRYLGELDLSFNTEFKSTGREFLPIKNSIRHIRMNSMGLDSDCEWFKTMMSHLDKSSIQRLHLNNNQFELIPNLTGLLELQMLYLRGNRIHTLKPNQQDYMYSLPISLTHLDIAHNFIRDISTFYWISNLYNLIEINAQRNRITEIKNYAFDRPNSTYFSLIQLDDNPIAYVGEHAFCSALNKKPLLIDKLHLITTVYTDFNKKTLFPNICQLYAVNLRHYTGDLGKNCDCYLTIALQTYENIICNLYYNAEYRGLNFKSLDDNLLNRMCSNFTPKMTIDRYCAQYTSLYDCSTYHFESFYSLTTGANNLKFKLISIVFVVSNMLVFSLC